jgi:hypothetical protein
LFHDLQIKELFLQIFCHFFHLWGDGGPNWHRDYSLWRSEQVAEWTLVGSKAKISYADAVRSNPPQKKPVFVHLRYSDNHVSNFVQSSLGSGHRSGKAGRPPPRFLANPNRQPNSPKRVLR